MMIANEYDANRWSAARPVPAVFGSKPAESPAAGGLDGIEMMAR